MKFRLVKKGYDVYEVDNYVTQTDYALNEQKQRIINLKKQIASMEKEIAIYAEKKELIYTALDAAVSKAEKLDKLSKQKYSQEMLRLKQFHDKWLDYYNKLLKKFPTDDLRAQNKFNMQMNKILSGFEESREDIPAADSDNEILSQFQKEESRLKGAGSITIAASDEPSAEFKPLDRIKDYLAKSDNGDISGFSFTKRSAPPPAPAPDEENNVVAAAEPKSEPKFSFEEALHPQQELVDIMRDLGLIEEN